VSRCQGDECKCDCSHWLSMPVNQTAWSVCMTSVIAVLRWCGMKVKLCTIGFLSCNGKIEKKTEYLVF
jgi:hypothetical protein